MRRAFWVLVFCATLIAACAPRLQKPEVSLAGIDLVRLGLLEQRFVLKLRIRNPNDVDVPVNALNFDVELNTRHFARGVSDKPVIIPRQGETILEVKTVSRLGDVLKPLLDAQKNGRERIGYRVFGSVDLEGYGNIPFDRSGDVSLSFLEKFAPK